MLGGRCARAHKHQSRLPYLRDVAAGWEMWRVTSRAMRTWIDPHSPMLLK